MRLLLDTHAFLWWLTGSERLSDAARGAITDEANPILVSAASAWEMATKHRLGRLPGAGGGCTRHGQQHRWPGFEGWRLLSTTAAGPEDSRGLHRDPFDRMLIAQALTRDLVLVSNETLFDVYGVRRLW